MTLSELPPQQTEKITLEILKSFHIPNTRQIKSQALARMDSYIFLVIQNILGGEFLGSEWIQIDLCETGSGNVATVYSIDDRVYSLYDLSVRFVELQLQTTPLETWHRRYHDC